MGRKTATMWHYCINRYHLANPQNQIDRCDLKESRIRVQSLALKLERLEPRNWSHGTQTISDSKSHITAKTERDGWEIGQEVEVYSKGQAKWISAKIIESTPRNFKVSYGQSRKKIRKASLNIRIPQSLLLIALPVTIDGKFSERPKSSRRSNWLNIRNNYWDCNPETSVDKTWSKRARTRERACERICPRIAFSPRRWTVLDSRSIYDPRRAQITPKSLKIKHAKSIQIRPKTIKVAEIATSTGNESSEIGTITQHSKKKKKRRKRESLNGFAPGKYYVVGEQGATLRN